MKRSPSRHEANVLICRIALWVHKNDVSLPVATYDLKKCRKRDVHGHGRGEVLGCLLEKRSVQCDSGVVYLDGCRCLVDPCRGNRQALQGSLSAVHADGNREAGRGVVCM